MKTTLNFACAALLALFTSSCLESTSTIRLNKDGSGTITEENLFSAEATAMMAQMAAAGGEDPGAKFADEKKAAAAAARMGEGVTVEKVEKLDKGGRKGGRVTYAFKDINQVKFSFGDAMSDAGKEMGPPGDAPAKKENPPMTFKYEGGVLTLDNPDKPADADAKKPAAGEDTQQPDPQSIAMMQQMFKGMKFTLKLEFPGGIAGTTASHVDGNTVTLMEMPLGTLMTDPASMAKLKSMQHATPAEIAGAFKGTEGFKMEDKDPVTVTLK